MIYVLPTLLSFALLAASGLVGLTNADRAAAGLPPLLVDAETQPIATERAAEASAADELSHYDAGGALIYDRELQRMHISYTLAGENLARCTCSVEWIEAALMASPAHRRNILEPRFSRVAVGVVDDYGRLTVAELFR